MRTAFLLLLAGIVSSAQTPTKSTQPLFRVGMTAEEMHAVFGEPQSYFDVRSQLHISKEEYLSRQGHCLCRPTYFRKTERNEYEITIFETLDDSNSRLHPTLRVGEIRFTLDRAMTEDEASEDISEVKFECGGKCVLLPAQFGGDREIARQGSSVKFAFSHGKDGRLEFVSMYAPAKK
jgi:hypothetical protein